MRVVQVDVLLARPPHDFVEHGAVGCTWVEVESAFIKSALIEDALRGHDKG
jgi:hypothetical protein